MVLAVLFLCGAFWAQDCLSVPVENREVYVGSVPEVRPVDSYDFIPDSVVVFGYDHLWVILYVFVIFAIVYEVIILYARKTSEDNKA